MNHFDVGQRRLAARTPIDESLRAVKQTLFPKANESLTHRKGKPFIHGKTLVFPIAGNAEGLELT